jgi:hypothetical protein
MIINTSVVRTGHHQVAEVYWKCEDAAPHVRLGAPLLVPKAELGREEVKRGTPKRSYMDDKSE